MKDSVHVVPPPSRAALLLADGTVFEGAGIGAPGPAFGEICFTTGMTGYQETLTDLSFAGQIITFTFPHIGNVGTNADDIEASPPPNLSPQTGGGWKGARGLVVREPITEPSNFRSTQHFNDWLIAHNIPGICGVDTRAITRHIRLHGAQNAAIFRIQDSGFGIQVEEMQKQLVACPDMNGLELASTVSTPIPYEWSEPRWSLNPESRIPNPTFHVVAIDYGEKLNILRCLRSAGCKVTVVPAQTPAKDILALKPDGIFLSNGPGDPAATGKYSTPILQELMAAGTPIFGICLGHQLLGLAMGAKTAKLPQGHRGANHPVKNLALGTVEITSQNHGFAVMADQMPKDTEITHISLFDGTVEGLRHKTRPVFSVQYHPESSPGPHDSMYLFDQFVKMMKERGQDPGFGIQGKRA